MNVLRNILFFSIKVILIKPNMLVILAFYWLRPIYTSAAYIIFFVIFEKGIDNKTSRSR